ncbi:MAG: VWA domain-containing protein [Thermoplasmata archaeon]
MYVFKQFSGAGQHLLHPSTHPPGSSLSSYSSIHIFESTPHGLLTGAEWNDLNHWDFFMCLMNDSNISSIAEMWSFCNFRHYMLEIYAGESPLAGARVILEDSCGRMLWTAISDNKGRVFLFVEPFIKNNNLCPEKADGQKEKPEEFKVRIMFNNLLIKESLPALSKNERYIYRININSTDSLTNPNLKDLDLMIWLDITGSMSDELSYLRKELSSVVENIKTSYPQTRIRISMNFYVGKYDRNTLHPHPFTESVEEVLGYLTEEKCYGGAQEAVDMAIKDGVFNHTWSDTARARLLLIIMDEPPEVSSESLSNLRTAITGAAEKGIRIIPVLASTSESSLQFLVRPLAIYTGGTFLFLTDDSGIGDPHVKPLVGDYTLEYFDQLMVRVIAEALV